MPVRPVIWRSVSGGAVLCGGACVVLVFEKSQELREAIDY